jgi:hypothetical protein
MLGQLDLEEATQEGWIKDQDGEVGIDGYNAIISLTTQDGSSGFKVQNSITELLFSVDSSGAVTIKSSISTAKIQLTFGAQDGFVLTSDLDGNANWVEPNTSSANITETEVDFGSVATRSKSFTIIDAGVNTNSKILASQSMDAATGKSQDENEMDALQCRCAAHSGQFILYVDSLFGPIRDKFKINYIVG